MTFVVRSSGPCKKIIQGTVPGKRKREGNRKYGNVASGSGPGYVFQQQSESSRGPSVMAEDCRRSQQRYRYDNGGSGVVRKCFRLRKIILLP